MATTTTTCCKFVAIATFLLVAASSYGGVSAQETPATAASPGPAAGNDCFTALLGMADCLTYVEDGSNLTKPAKECCPELSKLVDTNPICLCQLLGNPDATGVKIDLNRAKKLPSVCKVETPPLSTCSAVGVPVSLPPSSEDSISPRGQPQPGSAPTPSNSSSYTTSPGGQPVDGLATSPSSDQNGSYVPPGSSSGGLSGGAIAGIGIIAGLLLLAVYVYIWHFRKKKIEKVEVLSVHNRSDEACGNSEYETSGSGGPAGGGGALISGITVDKSVEFSYEELANATNNFSLANKIGQGGFGAVYYAELRGEKTAIKKMDMQASREFLAELKVLTHVHHLNLVRLIGYCVESSLFLVYEYIENGNLSQHLRGSGRDPLPWSSRVQIALDSARGLEYIHEHTVPVYIHRDIKPANILIDRNFHGKVADFGLTKLTEVGSSSLLTGRLVGTFGYVAPEYAQYGDVSPKVDVYAFGVVLYELISAKEAIFRIDESDADSKGLIALFEGVLNQPDPAEDLRKLVDPRLGDSYPTDSVLKMAQLAKACTQDNPQLRPSMRSIVVALMTLSSNTEDWDVGSFYDNQALVNLMSGR